MVKTITDWSVGATSAGAAVMNPAAGEVPDRVSLAAEGRARRVVDTLDAIELGSDS